MLSRNIIYFLPYCLVLWFLLPSYGYALYLRSVNIVSSIKTIFSVGLNTGLWPDVCASHVQIETETGSVIVVKTCWSPHCPLQSTPPTHISLTQLLNHIQVSAGQTHPQASPRGLFNCTCLCACFYMQAYGHCWSHTWPLTGTATDESDPKSVVRMSVEVAMGWGALTNSISQWGGVDRKYSSYQRLHLAAARSVALFRITCVLCVCADRVMAAGVVWEETETEGGRNWTLMVRGEKRGAVSFPGRAPRRIHLHLRSHLSPCRSSPHPTPPLPVPGWSCSQAW